MLTDALMPKDEAPSDSGLAKALRLMRGDGLLLLEIGFGDAKLALREAAKHPERRYISTDDNPELDLGYLQRASPDNLALVRAGMEIFTQFPAQSVDYVVLVNPYLRTLREFFRTYSGSVAALLKGEIMIKPAEPRPYSDTMLALRDNTLFEFRTVPRSETLSIFDTSGATYSTISVETVFMGKK